MESGSSPRAGLRLPGRSPAPYLPTAPACGLAARPARPGACGREGSVIPAPPSEGSPSGLLRPASASLLPQLSPSPSSPCPSLPSAPHSPLRPSLPWIPIPSSPSLSSLHPHFSPLHSSIPFSSLFTPAPIPPLHLAFTLCCSSPSPSAPHHPPWHPILHPITFPISLLPFLAFFIP